MFCGNCGKQLNDEDLFCPECGQAVPEEVKDNMEEYITSKNTNAKKKNGLSGKIAAVAILICLITAGIIILKQRASSLNEDTLVLQENIVSEKAEIEEPDISTVVNETTKEEVEDSITEEDLEEKISDLESEESQYQEMYNTFFANKSIEEIKEELRYLADYVSSMGQSYEPSYSYYEDCGTYIGDFTTEECFYYLFEEGNAMVKNVKNLDTLQPEVEYEGRVYRVNILGGLRENEQEKIVVPSFITTIRKEGLAYSNAREIVVPETVTYMSGQSTFRDSPNLEKVYFPENISTHEQWLNTFSGCEKLMEVTMPKEAVILSYTFENCRNLTNVTLSENTGVLNRTFLNCTSLKQVDLPESIHSMECAFNGSGIENVELPRFLTNLSVGGYMDTIVSENGFADLDFPKTLIVMDLGFYANSNVTEIIIPDHVLGLTDTYLTDCSMLTKIVIPDQLILSRALNLRNVPKLDTIVYPDTVTVDDIIEDDFMNANLEGTLTIYVPAELVDQLPDYKADVVVLPKEENEEL